MEQEIDYSNHFCNGEEVWKKICFECQYPTEKDRQEYFLNRIKKQERIIDELTNRTKLTYEEKKAISIFEDKEKEIKKLKDFLRYWILSYSRIENKILECRKMFKKRPYLKKKFDKILFSGDKKYDYPNYISKISILKNEGVKDDGGF